MGANRAKFMNAIIIWFISMDLMTLNYRSLCLKFYTIFLVPKTNDAPSSHLDNVNCSNRLRSLRCFVELYSCASSSSSEYALCRGLLRLDFVAFRTWSSPLSSVTTFSRQRKYDQSIFYEITLLFQSFFLFTISFSLNYC